MAKGLGDTLILESISHYGPQLSLLFRFSGGLRFSTSIWYEFPLEELDALYGPSVMEKIYFHCALFELNKVCTLSPSLKYIELGEWSCYMTEELERVWRLVTIKSFGEWRYLNNLPDWSGPQFCKRDATAPPSDTASTAIAIKTILMPKSLAFCGGGKDSLVSMKLLEEIGEAYSSLGYSHSLYGQASHQHELIDALVNHCKAKSHHHLTVLDEFLSSPIPETIPNIDVKSVKSSETFSALFEALPIALKHGYTQLILGHERCSDKGNLLWSVNDEYINHKWVKTIEAQSILNSYIRQNLISNVSYFSFLLPIHDTLIFQSLTRYIDAVPFTHSCNLRKPWCLRCPKCCYVWLGYSAYLPQTTVHDTFGEENLLDVEENQTFFIELLGLGEQTPFESVGEVDEVQLAFALCHSKGIKGKVMSLFEDKVADAFYTQKMNVIDKYTKVYRDSVGIPQPLGDQVLMKLEEFSAASQREITKACTE